EQQLNSLRPVSDALIGRRSWEEPEVPQAKKRFAQLYECLVEAKKAIAKEQSFFLHVEKALRGELKYFPFDSANYPDEEEDEFEKIGIAAHAW
ncbi:hypothetical protein CERZMDRAFT_92017, partial [Cercospora zeae-maydis SCOH1-5]